MLYILLKPIAILIFKIVFRLKVWGRHHIPKRGGFILASNHTSYLDPIVLGVACPRRLGFMARHDLFSNSLFSRIIRTLGAFPVKRDSPDKSAIKEAIARIKRGSAIVIFPEGSRQFNGFSSEPQPGIGFIAAKLNIPVIPAFIKGTELALPKGARFIKPHRIYVCIGREVSIERRMPYQDIAQRVMQEINQLKVSLQSRLGC